MKKKGVSIAPPPQRPSETAQQVKPQSTVKKGTGEKFSQVSENTMKQFNKRVPKHVFDGYGILSIKTEKTVPELIAEGLALLEEKYGKV